MNIVDCDFIGSVQTTNGMNCSMAFDNVNGSVNFTSCMFTLFTFSGSTNSALLACYVNGSAAFNFTNVLMNGSVTNSTSGN